jgi:hypothetical protein
MWLCGEGEALTEFYYFFGCPSYLLAQKLKAPKVYLRMWNETEFGNMENNKRALLDM